MTPLAFKAYGEGATCAGVWLSLGVGVAMFTNSCTRRLTYILLVNTPLHTHTHTHIHILK